MAFETLMLVVAAVNALVALGFWIRVVLKARAVRR